MVNEVNKIIFNTLVEQGAIYIPNIGTLSIHSTPSHKRGNRVVPPTHSVVYTTECKATSLSNVIMAIANIDETNAEDIVARWHKKINDNGRVAIDGVGTIANGAFTPNSELIAKLNIHNEPIYLNGKVRSSRKWWLIPLIVLSLVALGLNLYLLFSRDKIEPIAPVANTSTESLVTENITAENQQISNDTITTDSSTQETNTQEEEMANIEVINAEPAPEITEQKVEQEVEQTEAKIADWREHDTRHYVIFGSYSTMTNANTAIKKIERNNPAAQCKVIRIGTMFGIAVFGSDNHDECNAFKRNNRTVYKDAWIHTPKR